MKTKNNIRKTALKPALTVAAFALVGLTVDAQMGAYFKNTSNGPIAMITEKTLIHTLAPSLNTKTLAKTGTFLAEITAETDEPLQLEDWMLKENNFSAIFSIENETELSLKIEEWMINESNFETNSVTIENETEEELHFEKWMGEVNRFEPEPKNNKEVKVRKPIISAKNYVFFEETDAGKLKVENWMLNTKTWKIR